jgi:hypothetical protein
MQTAVWMLLCAIAAALTTTDAHYHRRRARAGYRPARLPAAQ